MSSWTVVWTTDSVFHSSECATRVSTREIDSQGSVAGHKGQRRRLTIVGSRGQVRVLGVTLNPRP
jgi:hypothetical protein